MKDLYADVTGRIVDALENGVVPWVRPWSVIGVDGVDRNGESGRPYSGVNVMLTAITSMMNGWTATEWYTFNQVRKLGGHVKKGSHATELVFFKPTEIRVKDEDTDEWVKKKIPLMRSFMVFNREQCVDLPEKGIVEPGVDPVERRAEVDRIVEGLGATISHMGGRASYSPRGDSIQLPPTRSFTDGGAYYSTLFHELVHWTGHPSRLGRLELSWKGSEAYAEEELVAELGSAYLCAMYGIDGMLQHEEYIGSWIRKLKDDKKAIFKASTAARLAVEYITDDSSDDDDAEEAA